MKQPRHHLRFRTDPRKFRTLVAVAATAAEREVVQDALAAVLPRDDVIEHEAQTRR